MVIGRRTFPFITYGLASTAMWLSATAGNHVNNVNCQYAMKSYQEIDFSKESFDIILDIAMFVK